jgi:hypothetical protein
MGHVMSIKTRLPFSFSDTKSSFTLSNLLLSIPECFVRVPENFQCFGSVESRFSKLEAFFSGIVRYKL